MRNEDAFIALIKASVQRQISQACSVTTRGPALEKDREIYYCTATMINEPQIESEPEVKIKKDKKNHAPDEVSGVLNQ